MTTPTEPVQIKWKLFIPWLESQPKDRSFMFADNRRCMLCAFLKETHGIEPFVLVEEWFESLNSYLFDDDRLGHKIPKDVVNALRNRRYESEESRVVVGDVLNHIKPTTHKRPWFTFRGTSKAMIPLESIRARYEGLTGHTCNLRIYEVQWTLFEWAKHYTLQDLTMVVSYLKRQIRKGERKPTALAFRNLFDAAKFMDDLSMARGTARVKTMDPGKADVLRATGRPAEVPSEPAKQVGELKLIQDLKRAAQ